MKRKPIKYERIKQERLKHQMTQEQVAKAIGVSKGTYAICEQGKRNFRITAVIKLAMLYNKSTDYLLWVEEN